MLSLLRDFEAVAAPPGVNVREEITGPVVDALYQTAGELSRTLSSGLTLHFVYRSKIARDFVMAADPADHVWEPQTTKLLLTLAKDARQAVIGGAYFGDHAVPLAHAMKRVHGTVHCFELCDEQLELLRRNARANSLGNLVANQIGLWHTDDALLELIGADSHARPRELPTGRRATGFPATTLNTYGARTGLASIDLLMLDIEGGELSALQGADTYLRQPRAQAPVVIFEVHGAYVDWSNGIENTEIVRLMEGFGYTVYAIRDYQGNVPLAGYPIEIIPVRELYLEGPPHGFNMFAIKDGGLLQRHPLVVCHGVSPKLLFHRDPRLHQPLHKPKG